MPRIQVAPCSESSAIASRSLPGGAPQGPSQRSRVGKQICLYDRRNGIWSNGSLTAVWRIEPVLESLPTTARIAASTGDHEAFLGHVWPVEGRMPMKMFDGGLVAWAAADTRIRLHLTTTVRAERVTAT